MTHETSQQSNVVLVTGPSGAGRSTAINVLEDIGFETVDNMPLSLIPNLLSGQPINRPIALGVDVRTRDFSIATVFDVHDEINQKEGFESTLMFLDCDSDVLVCRYNETRRRHPLAPDDAPKIGIEQEKKILSKLRFRADVLVDTTHLSPHDLRKELHKLYGNTKAVNLTISVYSFSYKRGMPRGVDMIFDCRFLKNPHWDKSLRHLNGTDLKVMEYIQTDARYNAFFEHMTKLCAFLLPAFKEEGKSHFSIGLGCTGGQHRSVCVAEALGQYLTDLGWHVSVRHREHERQ